VNDKLVHAKEGGGGEILFTNSLIMLSMRDKNTFSSFLCISSDSTTENFMAFFRFSK
jgi:hypothetical protein